ncbi:unnamed protein product [Ascophyllum nodosum]
MIGLVLLFALLPRAARAGTDSLGSYSSLTSSSSCNSATLSAMRLTWRSGELCDHKLPFEFWVYMKAEGTANDPDASHVRNECLKARNIGMVELITPEDWDSTVLDAAPGTLLRETKHTSAYLVESPLDFEAMCADEQVTKVSRVDPASVETDNYSRRKSVRRLQDTVSEAGNAHGVDALISGLEDLGCQRTMGEDQTLCIMADSFNFRGDLSDLQDSGDLPPDEFLTVVEDLSLEFIAAMGMMALDEGSAMMELAYDIAKGANFKFNTMVMGNTAAADDVLKLGLAVAEGGEGCDVIVDDIRQNEEPGFRDGVISKAVDEVVEAGGLYFSSAGNYRNGYKFTAVWECSSELAEGVTSEPCEDSGVASHVFNPDATGIDRYLLELNGELFLEGSTFILHWDEDEGTTRDVTVGVRVGDRDSDDGFFLLDRIEAVSDFGTAIVVLFLPQSFSEQDFYYISITQVYSDLEEVEMRVLSTDSDVFSDFSDGSIFAHKCAASTITVAAFDISDASGSGGAFADPEEGSVASYSSRGPCYTSSGDGLETRLKPETTAATGLETSSNPARFGTFSGTSAAAPVAAAIATIIRAACYPRVVTYNDMMEMLTNYDYTIDVTSDAGGEAEIWGNEAGYGIISAEKMLGWVAANCHESCSGAAISPTPVPTSEPLPVPPTEPPVTPRTPSPSAPPTERPAAPPTAPPTIRSTEPPVAPPTPSPSTPPTERPVAPPTTPPTTRPTEPPMAPRTAPPTRPPTAAPKSHQSAPQVAMPTASPGSLSPPLEALVDAGTKTKVTETANAYDTRTSGYGCAPDGCEAANTRDGDFSTRWSCMEDLLDGKNCEITYTFEEPQDIVRILIAFYKGDERTRELKVKINGSGQYVINSSGETTEFESFEINADETETLTLEGLDLPGKGWIAITEVQLMVVE